jgi:hypothetical protein
VRSLLAFLLVFSIPQVCLGWFENGHHLIAELAFDLLSKNQQKQIHDLIRNHPRFQEDFASPPIVVETGETDRWLIGRAAYWPDVARAFPEWSRPTWHYQLAATLTIGEVKVPELPGSLPSDATLDTQELYIAQAIELCRKVLRDTSRSKADRAIALCWIMHLVGDAHQPCHAGSLYVADVFPEGDRGANSILTKDPEKPKPLHLRWDGLLGANYNSEEIRRLSDEITADRSLWGKAAEASKKQGGLNPLTWLVESADYGRSHVYGPEVLSAVDAARRGGQKVEIIDLTEEYLQAAFQLSRVRAADAARRLAGVLDEALPK